MPFSYPRLRRQRQRRSYSLQTDLKVVVSFPAMSSDAEGVLAMDYGPSTAIALLTLGFEWWN